MNSSENYFSRFFGVAAQGQTYLNLLYLLFTFPLGIFYFTFLVTGFSVGIGLFIVWVGILILLGVFALSWVLTAFERGMAIQMLKVNVPPMSNPIDPNAGFWQKVKVYLTNPVTWKGIIYLFLKFPIGIINFTIVVSLGALSLGLMLAPALVPFGAHINLGFWHVDTISSAAILCVAGIALTFVSLHLFNWMAKLQGEMARYMLGLQQPFVPPVPPAPAQPAPTAQPAAEPAAPSVSQQ